jgi:ABC-2 type transport system ATP-binding protein
MVEQVQHDTVDIACAGVTKTFRDFWMRPRVRAVESVDLEVRRGQIYGLLGPNGSGKSTTIKMLLGLLQPTAGRIAILGKRPKDVETKRSIGYLPEESYLYRFLSGRETLDYYGRLFRLDRRARRERIDMLLDMVGLEAVQHRPVGEYSKGMQRRIGLAQSLINDPQLLILDEPTSGMDPVGARQIKDLIATLARRGKTVLLCSHLLTDVEDLCDRVAIMYGGRIRAEGTCEQLLEQEHATVLETSDLPDQVIAEVREVLRRHELVLRKVERPRRTLESLFLEIVEKARAEGVQTSGARSGGAVAEFLSEENPLPAISPAERPQSPAASAPVDTGLIDSLVRR